MKDTFSASRFCSALFTAILCLGCSSASAATSGQEILDSTGVAGGLVVHVGCGDGKLTAELHANARYLVQGLDTDADNVDGARRHIQSLGLYGKVSADRFDGRRLPYIGDG